MAVKWQNLAKSTVGPILNLPFLSKVLERTVAAHLNTHLSYYNLFEQFQFSYRPLHSAGTALVKIINDLLMVSDSGLFSILVLLLSAAFYAVSHDILLDRLASTGFTDIALAWLKSYLTDRTQFVQLKIRLFSSLQRCAQGSVLGPLLFTIYIYLLTHSQEISDLIPLLC